MSSKPIPTWFFATVVARCENRFVLVRETGPTEVWGLPGGKLDPGETFLEGARRETREEAGIEFEPVGILGFEHSPFPDGRSRMGAALLALVSPGAALKQHPDKESLGAAWFTLKDLDHLPLRGPRIAALVRMAYDDVPLISLDRIENFRFSV